MPANNIAPANRGYDVQQNAIGKFVFTHGPALYSFLFQAGFYSGALGDLKLHAMKSPDGGATWIEQDSASALTIPLVAGYDSAYTVGVDGSTVYVIYLDVSRVLGNLVINGFHLVTYDLVADLWGSSTFFAAPVMDFWGTLQAITGFQLITRSAGDMLFYFNGAHEVVSAVSYGRVYYCTFDGATFGVPVLLPGQAGNASNYTPVSAVYETVSGITTFVFTDSRDVGGLDHNLFSVGLTTLNAFGSVQLIVDGIYQAGLGSEATSDIIVYQENGNKHLGIFAWVDTPPDSFAAQNMVFYHATPALNPTWSAVAVASANDDTTSSYGPAVSVANNCPCPPAGTVGLFGRVVALAAVSGTPVDTLYGVWSTAQPIANGLSDTTSSYYYSSALADALTWGAASKLYSSSFAGLGGVSQGDVNVGGNQVFAIDAGGRLGVLGLNADTNENEYADFFALEAILSLTCGSPPLAFVGIGYSHTFPAAGGTPPYVFAITVGSLPPGLTLDPATGIVSGIPTTAGTYPFTIQVTDSVLTVVSVDCSIIVGGPTTSEVPIHNVWESGLARGNELSATMIRLAGADVWVRGAGPLGLTVYGPDKVLSQNPQLLLASGVPAAALTPNPGIMYALKLDFRQIENFTVRYETNTLDAWFELSGFRTYTKSDLFNR